MAGISLFALCASVLHVLMARDEPWRMSEFANSPYAALWMVGAYGLAGGSLCVLAALAPALPKGKASVFSIALLSVGGIGAVLIASFPVDVGPATTPSGHIHEQSLGPTIASMGTAMVVLGNVFSRTEGWRKLAPASLWLGVLVGVAGAGFLAAQIIGNPWVLPAQRLMVAGILAWLGLISLRLMRGPGTPQPTLQLLPRQ
jgi:uncharacterized membrane protein YidH (DUF202 family)